MHGSGKVYGHNQGFSCCFRQWRAQSHCNKLHGYAISVEIEFEAKKLNKLNWVVDFGDMQEVKSWLRETFDHKTLVAVDDPKISLFRSMHDDRLCDLVEVEESVGCEAFSEMIGKFVLRWMRTKGLAPRVDLKQVIVREHEANYAKWMP